MKRQLIPLTLFTLATIILAGIVWMSLIFYTAYFHPTKAVTVYINFFGEANMEAILITTILISASINFGFFWRYIDNYYFKQTDMYNLMRTAIR